MTTRQLRQLCRHYQSLLGMGEWCISVAFGDAGKTAGVGEAFICYGCAQPDPDAHTAVVTINREAHATDAAIRETLIHELLHVNLDPASTLMNDVVFETGLNRVARCVLSLESHPK